MTKMHPQVVALKKIDNLPQRTEAWFAMRKNKITSSQVASCLPCTEKYAGAWVDLYSPQKFRYNEMMSCNPYCDTFDYVKSVLAPKQEFTGNPATFWGQKYEDVIIKYYEYKYDKKVIEFGLLPCPHTDFIAASPDGITTDGIVLEIKCPKSRKINGIPPLQYWCQVQFHLQCAQLTQCDYIEAEIEEYMSFDEWKRDYDSDRCGSLIQVETIPDDLATRKYYYGNWDNPHFTGTYLLDVRNKHPNHIVRPIFFKLKKVDVIRIQRDDEWFERVKPRIYKIHQTIKYFRDNPTKPMQVDFTEEDYEY